MRTICAPAQRSLSRLLTEIRHIRCALGIDPDLSLFYNFVGLTPGSHSVCILGVNFGPSLLRQHDTLLCHSFFLLGGQWPTTHTHEMWDLRHMAYLFGDLSRRHGTATLSLALWDLVRLLLVILRTATDVGWLGCALGCASTWVDFMVVYWGGSRSGSGKRQGRGRGICVGMEGHPLRCWLDSWFPACGFGGHLLRGWRVGVLTRICRVIGLFLLTASGLLPRR